MATNTKTAAKPKRSRKATRGEPVARFPRITIHPERMGGMPCLRDYRFTVAQVLRLLAAGHSEDEILKAYPFLEREDLREALAYASCLAELRDEPIPTA